MDAIIKALGIWIYPLIFCAKLVEVSLSTVRVVLINRGEKVKGACIGFFEILIWLVVVSNVLQSITSDPVKALIYCLAFSCGNYLGVTIENKLAIGTACIQAVLPEEQTVVITEILRTRGFGVTVLHGHGHEMKVCMVLIYLKRKRLPEAMTLIYKNCPDAVATINDVRQVRNGVIKK